MRALLIVGLALFFTACSGSKGPQTGLKVEVTNLGAYASGGMVIFGSSGKNKFSRILGGSAASSQSLTLELPKGTWSIGAMAWDGAAPFQGDVSCDLTTAPLEEDEAAVKLSLQNATCFGPAFANETGGLSPTKVGLPVHAQFCEEDISPNTNESCDYDPSYDFSGVGPHPRKRGFVGSYKFEITSSEIFNDVTRNYPAESLETNCFPADTNQLTGAQLNVPAIVSGLGVPLKIVAYLAPACDETKGKIKRNLNDSAEAKFSVESTKKLAYSRITIADVCAVGGSKFGPASGLGDSNYPYVICNANQLKWLNQTLRQTPPAGNAERAAKYILGANIDLISHINKGNLNPLNTLMHPCVEEGDTWTPLGISYGAAPTCTRTDYSSTIALNFDGNYFTIRNVRYTNEGNYSGFIARTSGSIYNLTLDHAEIRGADKTGAIAGQADFIKNSRVKNSDIEGVNYVGGALGWSTTNMDTNARNHVSGTRVEGETRVGGVIGEANDISVASFIGDVHGKASSSMYIGGIVGKSIATVYEAASSGTLTTGGQIFGGIAGEGNNIYSSRSDMYIKDYGNATPRNIGGIAGTIASQLIDTYFHGYIASPCIAGTCFIGGSAGTTASTLFRNYSTQGISLGTVVAGIPVTHPNIRLAPFHAAICAGGPIGSCAFQRAAGDIPRLSFEESPCEIPLNNTPFLNQKTVESTRGSVTNPYRICHEGQLIDLDYPDATNGKKIVIEENINASVLSPIPTDTLDGDLDGKGHTIFALIASGAAAASETALLSDITGSVKNLKLAGFETTGTSCAGCIKGALSIYNNGLIENITVKDHYFEMTDLSANFNAGGVVGFNSTTGVISNVEFDGQIKAVKYFGGITGQNAGTIKFAKSRAQIEVLNGAGMGIFGGISASNLGLIESSTFRGEIKDTVGAVRLGGITGWLAGPTGSVLNSHMHPESKIHTISASTEVGGIAGYVTGSTNAITKSLVEGFIENPIGATDIQPIFGFSPAPPPIVNSFYLVSTYTLFRAFASLSTFYNAGFCEISISGASVDDPSKAYGALVYGNGQSNYFGDVTYLGTSSYRLDVKADSCANFTGAPNFFAINGPVPQTPNAQDLKNAGFNLLDLTALADKYTLFNVYYKWIESMTNPSVVVPTPPKWTFEDDSNEGFRVFRFD